MAYTDTKLMTLGGQQKGGMLKGEYNDDYSDDVTSVNLGMRYLYIPPTVNG